MSVSGFLSFLAHFGIDEQRLVVLDLTFDLRRTRASEHCFGEHTFIIFALRLLRCTASIICINLSEQAKHSRFSIS